MNRKSRKNSKNGSISKLITIFITTLTGVVAIGIAAIFIHKWVNQGSGFAEDSGYAHFKLTRETIPEGASAKEVEAAMEAAVEGIIKKNSRYAAEISDEDYLKANNIYVKESLNEESDTVTVTFAGDILFDPNYAVMSSLISSGGVLQNSISSELIDIMVSTDIMMLNNEFPYSAGGTPTEGKQYTFRADPSSARYLNEMDVDIVGLANNHAYDYGEQAFLDTMDTLNDAGITYVGAGKNIEEASSAVYYIINNMKIGFLAATQIEKGDSPDTKGATDSSPGVFRCWNNARLLAKIEEVKQNCDFLVVFIHWGTESTSEIDWAQQEQAPQIADAGADLIIGSHPHVLQPVAYVRGVPVVYSLGNFWFNSKELDTGMVQAVIGEDGLESLKFIPCLQSGCRTTLLNGEEGQRVISGVRAMSPGVNIDSEGYISPM